MKSTWSYFFSLLIVVGASDAFADSGAFSSQASQRLDAREEALMAELDADGLSALLRGKSQVLFRDPAEGLLFFPVEPCRLVDSQQVDDSALVHTTRLHASSGCGVLPKQGKLLRFSTAMSALVRIELRNADGTGSVALWRAGADRPASGLLDFAPGQPSMSTAIVPVCAEVGMAPCAGGDIAYAAIGAPVAVTIDLLGYFAPPTATSAASAADAAQGDTQEAIASRSLASPFWESSPLAGSIFYADGAVGIGTDSPLASLDVWGPEADYPSRAVRFVTRGESPSYRDQVLINNKNSAAAVTGYGLAFGGGGHNRGGLYARDVGGTASAKGEMALWVRDGGNILLNGGKVGIGTTPTAKLHVGGDLELNLGEGLRFGADTDYWGVDHDARLLKILDSNGTGGNADGGLVVESSTNDGNRRPILTFRHDSGYPNVGIGTVFPAGTLEAHSRRQAGTGTLTSLSKAVTGSGTSFTSQLVVGSELAVGNRVRRVAAIASDTELTLNEPYNTDLIGASFTYQQPALLLSGEGNLGLGTGAEGLTERLEVVGNLKLTGDLKLKGNLLASDDLCIGICP